MRMRACMHGRFAMCVCIANLAFQLSDNVLIAAMTDLSFTVETDF